MLTPKKPGQPVITVDANRLSERRAGFARMMRARRIAVIGASERNPFSAPVIRNFARFGYDGEVMLVNPRGEPVNGRPTLRSSRELDGPIDAAFVCVPSARAYSPSCPKRPRPA